MLADEGPVGTAQVRIETWSGGAIAGIETATDGTSLVEIIRLDKSSHDLDHGAAETVCDVLAIDDDALRELLLYNAITLQTEHHDIMF